MKLWDHQQKAVERARDKNSLALFFDVGTGKSGTGVNIAVEKYQKHGRILKTLIMGPIVVVEQWKSEWGKFAGDVYESECVALTGTTKKKLKKWQDHDGNIFIINHEAMNVTALYEKILSAGFELLILDESHRFKNPSAKKTKKMLKLCDQPQLKYRYILTGTPILNSPLDIWSQFRILDKDIFGANFYGFRGKYMQDKNDRWKGKQNYFPDWQPRPGSYDALNEVISEHACQAKKEDCLDLPPLIRQRVDVEMTPEQKRHYNAMAQDLITYLNDKACVAELALTKALRLAQITCGVFVSEEDDGERKVQHLQSNRVAALMDVIDTIPANEKFIIWTNYADTYKLIESALEDKQIQSRSLTGREDSDGKRRSISDFENVQGVRALIANQSAGGVGVNLVAASYSIYFARSFKLEDDLQSEARNYRGGSEKHAKVTRIDLVAPGTIDEYIIQALESKQNVAQSVAGLREKLAKVK